MDSVHVPRPKPNCRLKPSQQLPLIQTENGLHRFRGVYNGFCVVITDLDDAKRLVSMGYFGKGTLSRCYPNFQRTLPEIVRRRCFQRRKRFGDQVKPGRKIIVVPDSSSEDEDYFTNLLPEYALDCSGIEECVNLAAEEAFFLKTELRCLDVFYKGNVLNEEELWEIFAQSDRNFVQNYVVYHYFRSKNWVVKPGIKFGGDFLLYKQGPPFYHASYVVIISVVDKDFVKIKSLNRRSMSMQNLVGLNRLCETARKELLICEIVWPDKSKDYTIGIPDLSKFTVKETVMKRWISSQERQSTKTQSPSTSNL